MPRHMLKLLPLVVAITVTPAVAGNSSSCPYERARLAALAPVVPVAQSVAPIAAARSRVPTRITLIDRVPPDSLLGLGRNSGYVSP